MTRRRQKGVCAEPSSHASDSCYYPTPPLVSKWEDRLARRVRLPRNGGFHTITFSLRAAKDTAELERSPAGLRSDVTFLSSPQEERVIGTTEMPLSKFGVDVFW